jgi:ubiquinone/menaquinone biosynthesis C-methylase UbiE
MTDQAYLSTQQYHNASNLDARVSLHERFSVNPYGWHRWVFDQFELAPGSRILEVGCGPAYLWRENVGRIPGGWEITLTDFSPGMVQQARENLHDSQYLFRFGVADAQAIPFADASFDAVIANHMLYHVPDRAKALSEFRRVLRSGGRLYLAANGRAHLREMKELTKQFALGVELLTDLPPDFFGLDDGQAELSQWFSEVTLRRYEDALAVTEAAPLVAFIQSSVRASPAGDNWTEFTRFVEQELADHGAIHITKDPGLFVACV